MIAALLACLVSAGNAGVGASGVFSGDFTVAELAVGMGQRPLALDQVAAVRRELWEKYRQERELTHFDEHRRQELHLGDDVMKYTAFRQPGSPPRPPLFIALHGGGGAPPRVNDQQWQHMKSYYRDSISDGVYVAPRGVTNTWNLHSVPASYPLYDRLIENMIAFENVDPNRVYLLGFSAGGDGTYQTTPRLADRFAAANMSAGHHNGVNPRNLFNVPFLLQVGERDTAYNRHQETVRFAQKLLELGSEGGGYQHEVWVHHDRPHNFRDNDPQKSQYPVLADPIAWLAQHAQQSPISGSDPSAILQRDTNAIRWLRRHRRNPVPQRVVWDLTTTATRIGDHASSILPSGDRSEHCYWLSHMGRPRAALECNELSASFDRPQNTITVHSVGSYVGIWIDSRIADLTRPVRFELDGQVLETRIVPNLRDMATSLYLRGDPELMFVAFVPLEKRHGRWQLGARPLDARF